VSSSRPLPSPGVGLGGTHRLECQELFLVLRPDRLQFRRSSYCSIGQCVEIAFIDDGVAVRDGKSADGPILAFTREEWDAFVRGVRAGEFDLPS
jgi:hypothetical protein